MIIPHKMPLAGKEERERAETFLFLKDFTFNFSTMKGRVLVGMNILTFCQEFSVISVEIFAVKFQEITKSTYKLIK